LDPSVFEISHVEDLRIVHDDTQQEANIQCLMVPRHLCHNNALTNNSDSLDKSYVICDDLAELWEVPTIPFPTPHDVVVQLLVQIIQETNSLYNHCIYLVRAEFQFVSRKAGNITCHVPLSMGQETNKEF
jgi:hypothetical protein